MLFSSLEFIFRFFLLFLFVYYLTKSQYRNWSFLIGSICFYILSDLRSIPYLLLAIFVNYCCGIMILSTRSQSKTGKLWLTIALSYHIFILFFFKYVNFFFHGLDYILHDKVELPEVSLCLPLGISFFTFTSISYVIDLYQGRIKEKQNLKHLIIYTFSFPQLLSGPITRYDEFVPQLIERKYGYRRLENGLRVFVIGLGYKVILANQLSTLWNYIETIGFESISTPLAWIGMLSFSLQLYFDFSGYSLMAIGIGEMLGFTLPVNFAHPYMSKSIGEFFRRWHITLGKWFRDYVYIPLGGNRLGKVRMFLNLAIVWLLTGLWHGAAMNFILWGIYLFCFIFLEKLFLNQVLQKFKVISRLYLWLVIGVSWMIFAITDVHQLGIYLSRMFPIISGNQGVSVNALDYIKQIKNYGVLLGLGCFLSSQIPMRWYIRWKNNTISTVLLLIVFWYCIYLLAIGKNNPFLYFRF